MEENIKPKKKWGARKVVSLVLFVIILSAVVYWAGIQYSEWWKVRKQYIDMGFASDKFPFRMFTERELVEKGIWPVESRELMSVPTRITPEETYATFRQALIDWDIDKAVGCFAKEKQAKYREDLLNAKEEGRIPEIIEKLTNISPEGERVTKGSTGDALASYELLYKEKESDIKFISHSIGFIKDWNGDWKMENL